MSEKKKDTKTIIAQAFELINKYTGKKIVALDMTTKEGDKITFPDVADGELPKAGDTATIDGKPVMDTTVTIVDNDGEFTITFDAEGKVVQDKTEEEVKIEALETEIAELKGTITAMATEFKTTLLALQGADDEDETYGKKNDGKKSTTVTASLDDRLNKLKEKKATKKGTIV